jgi:hypothetical protein
LALIHHPTIPCYILSVITIFVNQPTKRQTYMILTTSLIKDPSTLIPHTSRLIFISNSGPMRYHLVVIVF